MLIKLKKMSSIDEAEIEQTPFRIQHLYIHQDVTMNEQVTMVGSSTEKANGVCFPNVDPREAMIEQQGGAVGIDTVTELAVAAPIDAGPMSQKVTRVWTPIWVKPNVVRIS